MTEAAWADNVPRFVISVAAELAQMHPQTLRQYDKLGLVVPGRSPGRGRRYSARDVAALREVQRLSAEEGINLAGIQRILALEAENRELKAQVEFLRAQIGRQRRIFAVHPQGQTDMIWFTAARRGAAPPE